MNLQTRITIFVCAAFALLAAALLIIAFNREARLQDRMANTALTGQGRVWAKVVEKVNRGMASRATGLTESPQLADLVGTRSIIALRDHAAPLVQRLRDDAVIDDIQIQNAEGRVLFSTRTEITERSIIDAGLIMRVIDQGAALDSVEPSPEGGLISVVALPLLQDKRIVGVITLARAIAPVVQEVGEALRAQMFLTDARGQLLTGSNAALWQALAVAPDALRGVITRHQDGKTYSLSVLPLTNGSGTSLGSLIAVTDITDDARQEQISRSLTIALVALVLGAMMLVLYFYLQRAFEPLNDAIGSLKALSFGDTSIEISGEGSRDEIGRIVSAIRIFRDQELTLSRQAMHQQRQALRQLRFIRQQMESLAHTLDERARAELQEDLARIESESRAQQQRSASGRTGRKGNDLGALAVAFQVMTQRVIRQHQSLDQLIAELRDALAAKTELVNLQQQMDIANKMQASMLPQAFPPRPDLELRGDLLPADEFGGEFYDFYTLPDGRIAMTAAQVGGIGLAVAFLTLTARTVAKATAQFNLSPAQCLTRVNSMLLGENRDRLHVAMLFGIFDPATGLFTYASGGFALPLLIPRLGVVEDLPGTLGPMLATHIDAAFTEQTIELPLRSTLLLYSAGVIDAAGSHGGRFGKSGLLTSLQACDDLSADGVVETTLSQVRNFTTGTHRSRDATCVALRWLGRPG